MAKVVVRFDAWKAGNVAPSEHEVPVSLPRRSTFRLEAVSPRLKQELIHPNRSAYLWGVRFCPDGKRLIAGDYPGGQVVLWDVTTGKQQTVIETGFEYRSGSFEYFFLSPDWQTLYVPRFSQKTTQVEQDGKRTFRWEFGGGVRAWDLNTGRLLKTYKDDPARGIHMMQLFSDGTKFLTSEELPGSIAYEKLGTLRRKYTKSVWDVQTGQHRSLPYRLGSSALLSRDGRMIAIDVVDDEGNSRELKLFDLATWRPKWSVPLADKNVWLVLKAMSPDGRLIVGNYLVYASPKKSDTRESLFKWYDTANGQEVASFVAQKDDGFYRACFSPDGKTIAAISGLSAGQKTILSLFGATTRKLAKTVPLDTRTKGERLFFLDPVFSPDSKWLAVITQVLPDTRGVDLDPADIAQARIHLIDVATGEIRETLIAPQGIPGSACFSPDGRTLATSGQGRVLLWDLARPPGTLVGARDIRSIEPIRAACFALRDRHPAVRI